MSNKNNYVDLYFFTLKALTWWMLVKYYLIILDIYILYLLIID